MMTSSVAASTTSLLPPNATKAPDIGPSTLATNNNSKENSPTAGPITEIFVAQTAAAAAAGASLPRPTINNLTTVNSNSAKPKSYSNTNNSKIPHPHPHPLAVLLATKTNQFRRSASLRMRGSKSNLLFTALNRSDNNNTKQHNNPFKAGGVVNKKMEQHNNATRNSSLLLATTKHENETSNDQQQQAYTSHELSTSTSTGRVSPRRKLLLSSQLNADAALTRSLSLRSASGRRKSVDFENQSVKTNSSTESCQSRETLKDVQLQDNALDNAATKAQENNRSTFQKQSENDGDADGGVNLSGSSTPKAQNQCEHEIVAKCDDCVQILQKEDINKMSLNFNGPTASTATTTTNVVRPTTLATAASSSSPSAAATATTTTSSRSLSKSTLASPKTPKTPTSAKTFPHSRDNHNNNNHCHNHQHCSKYQQPQVLPTVPETKLTPRTPPVTPDSPNTYLEDDLDSLYSFATTTSGRSTMSCEHPYVARNGTTFSGRKMKYVVHCSNYAGQVGADYLTPTQRAQRQIRRLKELLCIARQDLEQKDSEILRLTREVVELRLFKASLSSPEDRSASSDAVTVREAELKTSQDVSPIVDMVDESGAKSSLRHIPHCSHHHQHGLNLSSEMQSSFADSGHFEDMTSSSVHSKDSYAGHTHDIACGRDGPSSQGDGGEGDHDDDTDDAYKAESYERQRQELIRMYEQRIEDLIRTQDTATSEIKRSHNDKVEALLQKLAECNTRYADIVPDYEHAKERIRELEKQLEDLQRKLIEHEDKQNKMYLHMYQQGQEAERIARADQALELAHRAPNNKVSINELLHQLQSTQDELENIRAAECRKETGGNHALLTAKEAISLWVLGARKTIYRRLLDAQKNRTHVDPEVTLQFLKSAVYYFLTDKENSQGHLQAIESILEFTEAEKQNINKARSPK